MFTNLRIIKDGAWLFAEFTRDSETCKRLILPQAEEKAREIAESGDPYKIDGFCYRIY